MFATPPQESHAGTAPLRQHIGSVLRIAASDRTGCWLGVVLIEEDDDAYLVVAARELDNAERDMVQELLEGGGPR